MAALYKYVDDQGVTNFTDSMSKVPEKYRSRATLVKKQIQVESGEGGAMKAFKKLNGQTALTWKDFMTLDKDGNAIGFNPRALFIQSLFESKADLLAGRGFYIIPGCSYPAFLFPRLAYRARKENLLADHPLGLAGGRRSH